MDLDARRAEIFADHQAQEKYDPHWKGEAEKGRRLSLRPLAFICDDEVVVLGDDVGKVLAGVAAFESALAPAMADPDRALAVPNYKRQAFARARKLLADNAPPPAELRVSQAVWNHVACALEEAGVLVVLADGTHGG